MFEMFQQQVGGLDKLFVDGFSERLTIADRKKIADALENWLKKETRLKPLPDLEARLAVMSQRIRLLAQTVEFTVRNEEIVVISSGANEQTLKAIANGTDWFDPCDDVVSVMISAVRN